MAVSLWGEPAVWGEGCKYAPPPFLRSLSRRVRVFWWRLVPQAAPLLLAWLRAAGLPRLVACLTKLVGEVAQAGQRQAAAVHLLPGAERGVVAGDGQPSSIAGVAWK